MTNIQVGDVCLDLAQGRPVHIVEAHDGDAAEWSERNNYELTENYGNSRLGASDDDAVFEVVYCSSLKSEPSKTYAMPESRLGRVETESADDGRPVADRVRVDLLERLIRAGHEYDDSGHCPGPIELAQDVGMDADAIDEARELADAALLSAPGDEGSDDDHRLEGAEPQRDLTDAEPATVPDDSERDDNDDPVFPEVEDDA